MINKKLSILSIVMILCLSSFSFAKNQKDDAASYQKYYIPGLEYAIQGRFLEAQEQLNKIIAKNHLIMQVLNDSQANKVNKEAAISIFQAYYDAWNNNWDQMIRGFNKAIELDPGYVLAYICRGSFYYDLQLYDKAISDYSKVIELAPNNPLGYGERGGLYIFIGDNDKAIVDLEKAIELDPTIISSYQNLGNAYYFKKEFDKAIAIYQKLLGIESNFVHAYYALALAYDDKGDKEEAIKYYNHFIKYAPYSEFESLIKKAKERLQVLG